MAPLSYCGFWMLALVAITDAFASPKARRRGTRLNYAEESYSRPPSRNEYGYYQEDGGYYPEQEYGNQGYDQYNSNRAQRAPRESYEDYQRYDNSQYGYDRRETYDQRRDDEYYQDRRMDNSMNRNQDYRYNDDGYGEERGQPLVPQENYEDYPRYDDNQYGYDRQDYEQQQRENDDYYSDRRAGGSLSRPNSWFDDPFFASPFSTSHFPSMLSPMLGASMLDSFFSPFSSPFGSRRRGTLSSPFARMDAMMDQIMSVGPSMGEMMRQQQEQLRAQTENIQDLLDEALAIVQNDPVVRERVPAPIDVVAEGNPIFSQSSKSAMAVDVNGEQRQTQRTEFGVRLNNQQWSLWLATEGGRLQEATLVDNTDPTNPIHVPVPGADAYSNYNAQPLPENNQDEAGWRNVLPSPSTNERPRRKMDNEDDVIDVEAVEV